MLANTVLGEQPPLSSNSTVEEKQDIFGGQASFTIPPSCYLSASFPSTCKLEASCRPGLVFYLCILGSPVHEAWHRKLTKYLSCD